MDLIRGHHSVTNLYIRCHLYRDLCFQTLLWLTVDYVTQCFGWAWLWSEILAQIYTEFVKCNFIKTTVFLQAYKKEILLKGLHMFD